MVAEHAESGASSGTGSIPARQCPICGADGFDRSGEARTTRQMLKRWEQEASIVISPQTWQDYSANVDDPIYLHHCRSCDFRLFVPVLAGSASFYADITAVNYYVSDKWEFRKAVSILKRNRCRRLLDIGCGSGYFLDKAKKECGLESAEGYEFAEATATPGRAKGHTVYSGPFAESIIAALGDRKFDAITCFQVLEHLEDPAGFLAKVRPLLADGGTFVLSVPNAAGPLRHFSDALTDLPPHHVSRWTLQAFRKGLPRFGFKVKRDFVEPLPEYLWNDYVPIILIKDYPFKFISRRLNRRGWTARLLKVLRRLGFRTLPITGHTILAELSPA